MKKYRYFPLEYKQQIVNEIESGIRTKAAIAREEHLSSSLIDRWQKQIHEGTMIHHPSTKERQLERELERYKKKVGELTLENDLLKKIDEYCRSMRRSNGSIVTGRSMAWRRDVKS
jgi:transposase-like protein